MQRYDLYDDGEMIGDAEGVWVRYDDVVAALAATSAPAAPSALGEEHEPSLLTLAGNRQSMSQISGADLRAFVNDVLGAITFIRPLQQSATSAPSEPAAPRGWKLVPMEPSEQMFTSFSQQIETGVVYVGGFVAAYRCMLDAAPQPVPAVPVAWVDARNLKSAAISRERGGPFDAHAWSEGRTAIHDTPLYDRPPGAEVEERRELSNEPTGRVGSLLSREELLVGNLVAATLAEERAHEADAPEKEKDDAADRFIRAKGAVLRALQFSLRQKGDA